ncbi:hypothetical protein ACLMJK_006892 [Lecanora helva]
MSLPKTHTHPSPLQTLAPNLLPHLPNSLALLRRLQFHHHSPSAHVIATFPPSFTTIPPEDSFSAAYVDRSVAPETECWIFSTYETAGSIRRDGMCNGASEEDGEQERYAAKSHLLALLQAIAHLPPTTDPPEPLMILGAFPETLLPGLLGGQELQPQNVISRKLDPCRGGSGEERKRGCVLDNISKPYMKWLIYTNISAGEETNRGKGEETLPQGYFYSELKRGELKLVISRTDIPKTEEDLARLGHVGVRYTPAPEGGNQNRDIIKRDDAPLIAWSFIKSDGSLSTLHVEPAHRGKGIAKAISSRLFTQLARSPREMGFRPVGVPSASDKDGAVDGQERDPSLGLAHSDVAVDNLESAGVARGLGGREGWGVRWVSVDLRRVEGAVGGVEGGMGEVKKYMR